MHKNFEETQYNLDKSLAENENKTANLYSQEQEIALLNKSIGDKLQSEAILNSNINKTINETDLISNENRTI
jgi:hypothetical protein